MCMYVCMYVYVCRYGDLTLLEWLVRQTKECGDVDLENLYGDTALALACRLGQLEMVSTYIHTSYIQYIR